MVLAAATPQIQDCPARPYPNTVVTNPLDLTSSSGVLNASLTLRSREMMELPLKVCYVYAAADGTVEAPTLRVQPGDLLNLSLTNRLTYVRPHKPIPAASRAPHDPCSGGVTATTSTNIDFAGLDLPFTCHEGDIVDDTIENADSEFTYRVRIPEGNPPGMYLYEAHRLGSMTLQVNGGASGVLIVSGMEKAKPEVADVPERILVIREQFDEPDFWPPSDPQYTLNFEPAASPNAPSPIIEMRPGKREFWRVANATSQAFVGLQFAVGKAAQPLTVIARDGIPLRKNEVTREVELAPGGRAEFLVTAPASGESARLLQSEFETGRTGLENPSQELARIVTSADGREPPAAPPSSKPGWVRAPVAGATMERKLYLAEAANGTSGPARYFIAVEGQAPRPFRSTGPPAFTTRGGVEDWIIANHTGEVHALHLHRVHGALMEVNGRKLASAELRDTVTIPAWTGAGPFPTVRLRVDLRDGESAGSVILDCHILHHAEHGMTARIEVER